MHDVELILGFDFGMKYIGVAIGQRLTKTARPLLTLRARDGIPDWQELLAVIDKWQAKSLVVGQPANELRSKHIHFAAKKFANRLQQQSKLPVQLIDEHLTSWEAKNLLQQDKKNVNYMQLNANAAAIILQDWLSLI